MHRVLKSSEQLSRVRHHTSKVWVDVRALPGNRYGNLVISCVPRKYVINKNVGKDKRMNFLDDETIPPIATDSNVLSSLGLNAGARVTPTPARTKNHCHKSTTRTRFNSLVDVVDLLV